MAEVVTGSPRKAFRDGVQIGWDATSITTAMTCLRKYQLSMIENWRPVRKSVHLSFGGIYASALEQYYKHKAEGLSHDEATVEVVDMAMKASWGVDFQGHTAKTRYNLMRAIVWYLEEFGVEDTSGLQTHHFSDGRPAVEVSFQLTIDDDLTLTGHMDRVSRMGDDLYVVDQKTTGMAISAYYFDQFNPDNQFTLYTLAGQMIFDAPIKGVIIDAAQIAPNFIKFGRGFTSRQPEQIQEWFKSARYTIDSAQNATRTGFFPMNTTACGNYGGCPYRAVCSRPAAIRPQFLKADFTQETSWDPMENR